MINRVILTGRLTSDVEIRKTNDGTSYVLFNLAVNRRGQDQTDFVPCIAWRQAADLMERYLRKGSLIGVEGTLQVYSQQKNGNYETRVNVSVNTITFLETRNQSRQRETESELNFNNNKEMTFSSEPSFNQNDVHSGSFSKGNTESHNTNNSFEEIDASDINLDDIKF